MSEPHYVATIKKYSDYSAHDPYWINLYHAIDSLEIRKKISDALNKWFHKHGPDANEDYTSFCGPLMQYETAKNALTWAVEKCGRMLPKNFDVNDLIDGGFSTETDGRENDPVTGELLHACPVNKEFIIDEIRCLIDQNKLSKDDWVWLDYVVNSCGDEDMEVNAMLRQLTRKHR